MKKSKMTVNTNLGALDYVMLVNNLASEYFYSDGEYAPHVGILNVMHQFYKHCVTSEYFADMITEDMDSIKIVDILATDDEFIDEFNRVLWAEKQCLDFANAYRDAMEIVETRKTSLNYAVDVLKNVLSGITDKIASTMTQDNLDVLKEIAGKVPTDKVSAETFIAEAFAHSDKLKEITSKQKK